MAEGKDLHEEIVGRLDSLSKRARIVVEHILEHGLITTEELERDYGYSHPPRAARDVRESGIPLETIRVRSSDGRLIAAYKLRHLSQIESTKTGGRRRFPKRFKAQLYESSGSKCAICFGHFEMRYLQVDHRVPYEISGDMKGTALAVADFMLLCGSCNRAKSWSCEHCPNWLEGKSGTICERCYWANPQDYSHVGLREIRRADILWDKDEIQIYERLKELALKNHVSVPEYVKNILSNLLSEGEI